MPTIFNVADMPTIFNVFKKELELVKHKTVYDFVTQAFAALCPNYFWYISASTRGHHPPICRTRGGLVHHVKLAVAFADSILDMLGVEDDLTTSQVITAVLLHDMLKRGAVEDETQTWSLGHRAANQDHGRYCARRLTEFHRDHVDAAAAVIQPIITAVRLHMGRWSSFLRPEEIASLQINEVVRTVHLADYCASRALHQYLAERAMDTTMGYLKK